MKATGQDPRASPLFCGVVNMFLNGGEDQNSMRKALAQNPNLLRTLLGLSFTLIFMLSYAVYANTIDTAYYTYTTEATTTTQSSDDGMTLSASTTKRIPPPHGPRT